jgi:hypothetical protein
VFSWDIGTKPQIEKDHDRTSEVEVRFVAESPLSTRLVQEHRLIERHGPNWESLSDGVAGEDGWPLYLDRYPACLQRAADVAYALKPLTPGLPDGDTKATADMGFALVERTPG